MAELNRSMAELNRSTEELNNYVYSYNDDTSKCFDRLNNQVDLILEMVRALSNQMTRTSPLEDEPEFSAMNPNPDDITVGADCDERSEPNMQKVDAITSTTPIAGTSPIPIRFEEACSEVYKFFDESTESPTVLFNEQANKLYAHYLFDENPQPFLREQNSGNGEKKDYVLPTVDLQSVLISEYVGAVNGSTNDSTIMWFEKVTSILKVALWKTVMEAIAHELFDKGSKLRTLVDEIWLFVFDPGGSLLLQMDCDPLTFSIRFQLTIALHYVVCVLADVPNCSVDWDYTINMGKIISKEIDDKYSKLQNVFTKALKSLDIWFLRVEIDDVGNIVIDINRFVVPPLTKPRHVLIFELHRHDEEDGCGQVALVVFSPSSMIEMCLLHVMPNFEAESYNTQPANLFVKTEIMQGKRECRDRLHDVFQVGQTASICTTFDKATLGFYNENSVDVGISNTYDIAVGLSTPTYTAHRMYVLLGRIKISSHEALAHGVIYKSIQSYSCFKQSQVLTQTCCVVELLLAGLKRERLHSFIHATRAETTVQKDVKVQIQNRRDITGAPIMILIVQFSEKDWVAEFLLNRNDSSAAKVHEDFGSKIMSIGLDMSWRKELNWVWLLCGLNCFQYARSMCIIVTKL